MRQQQRVTVVVYGKDLADRRAQFEKDGIRCTLYDSAVVSAIDSAWQRLRLGDEQLLVVQVSMPDVAGVVEGLKSSPLAAVFAIPVDSDQPMESVPASGGGGIKDRLSRLERCILQTHQQLLDAVEQGHFVSPAAQWLLDNAHALRSHISDIRQALSRKILAKVSHRADGLPNVSSLAENLVEHLNGVMSEVRIVEAIHEAQRDQALLVDEIWLLPALLRLALVEFVASDGKTVRMAQEISVKAHLWANRLAVAHRLGEGDGERILSLLAVEPLSGVSRFVVALAEELQDEDRAMLALQGLVETIHGKRLTELASQVHQAEAQQGLRIANAFNSLRKLTAVNFVQVFEQTSRVERELRLDADGIYARSDADTRNRARRAVQTIASASGLPEWKVARAAAEPGPDKTSVLDNLIAEGRPAFEQRMGAKDGWRRRLERFARQRATLTYVTTVLLLTVAFCSVAILLTIDLSLHRRWILWPLWILALFPLSELAIQIVNMLVISVFQASPLPKMDFKGGIPDHCTTLVVVPMMLSSSEVIARELEKLEIRYLANPGRNVYFSLLSDFADANQAAEADDDQLSASMIDGIDALNAKYGGSRFLAFHRPRTWSESEQKWIGRERKRGKIEELNNYLAGEGDAALLVAGSKPANQIRYVITLDADTQLPPETARRLIETIAHPLNHVDLDPVTKVRRHGYSIIQPRVSISLPGATASRFTRIMGDPHGTDPYCRLVSDSQQDLFGHAIFHGKAIYDVAAFRESLANRFPDETILSHDLIEGAHCGVGLATDIELFESMPTDYASYSRRQQRWIRGDWQIAPWLLPRVPTGLGKKWKPNPLSAIHRWRVFDNLRRSLVPPASVALLLVGWFLSETPTIWTLVLTLAILIPALAILLDQITLRLQGAISGSRGSYDELLRAAVTLCFLPHQAWLSFDAILRACYRMSVSRRKLLEWQTAESSGRVKVVVSSSTMQQLSGVSALSALIAVLQAQMLQGSAMPLLVMWSAAPLVAIWSSRSVDPELLDQLDSIGHTTLRKLARRTWRFFDDLVGPATNWLPPDNTQLALHIEVANRTSPTNIGLWMNSAQAAHDFGYLTLDDLLLRLQNTVSTLERMEKHEGHFLNWYRTDNLDPLPPRYISTVDSGNLLASLWVQQRACHQMIDAEPVIAARVWKGLADTFRNLLEAEGRNSRTAFELRAIRRLLRVEPKREELAGKLRILSNLADKVRSSVQAEGEIKYWSDRLCHETITWIEAVQKYDSWLDVLTRHPDSRLRRLGSEWPDLRRTVLEWQPSLSALAAAQSPLDEMLGRRRNEVSDPTLAAWLDELQWEFGQARDRARQAVEAWGQLAKRLERLSDAFNMAMLFDEKRKLFGIGYAVGGPIEFHSHYDLLASECRIASLVSIAKGDVPLEHWAHLGRPRTPSASGQTLLSWSGTMFEYLMPLLFVRSYPNSLLEQACRDAVQRQMEYGGTQGLPWGVSESAYSAIDAGGTYQYHAFGVPSLSLRGETEAASVVAPYASVLSLQVDPKAAMDNLERLEQLGLDGPMGYYEAIDFSQKPSPESEDGVVIYCYMAHHQGMSLIAIDNLLNHGAMQLRFHSDLRIRAIESLLFERIPNSPLVRSEESAELAPPSQRPVERSGGRHWNERTPVPRVQFLGNGRLSTAITNSGGGYCKWKEFDISRWRCDSATDRWGNYVVLRDVNESRIWSTTYQPVGGDLGTFSATFTSDRAAFHRRVDDIESTLEVVVSPEDDVEIKRLRVTNWSNRPRLLDATSFMELALSPHGADRAHPAFSKMFVQTESPERGVLIATRRKRSPADSDIWVAQMLVGPVGAVSFETDREKFVGRSNSVENADGYSRSLGNSTGAVVDPAFCFRCRLNLSKAGREEFSIITIAADSREALLLLIAKHRRPQAIPQVFDLAWNRAQLDLRYLRIGPEDVQLYQHLGSGMLYPDPNLRGPIDRMAKDRLGQSALWASSISGDLPMLTVTIPDTRALVLLRELLVAHNYLRMRGLRFDLIVLNQEPVSYDRPLHLRIRNLVEAVASEPGMDKPGGVFVRDSYQLPDSAVNQMLAASHVFLRGSRGGLNYQLGAPAEQPPTIRTATAVSGSEEPSPPLPFLELPYFNGVGGFTKDGREYAVYLAPGVNTPTPWANVIAHDKFGTMVTESGLGFTWCGNSQANRLTPWHNDPVSDPQSEVIFLRDEESGRFWNPTALPIRERDAYRARHGQGYTVFEHSSHAIEQELTVFVPFHTSSVSGDNVKLYHLRLRNYSSRPRTLTATFFAEFVLGVNREEQQLRVNTTPDTATGSVFASQWWTGARAGEVAFVASWPQATSYSGDRVQFIGRNRSIARPDAMSRVRLDNRTGLGLDPAGALQVSLTLAKGGEAEVVFMLGQCATAEQCRVLIQQYQDLRRVKDALQQTKAFWDVALGGLTVKTPVLSVDLLLNRWLLYQSLSCRFWGRSALYQSGGAVGFRDQLQDSLAMLYAFPHLTRAHILMAASRQFEEGDVQHWWHPDTGLGVRTRCSDDLLWLPYVVAHYAEHTGDLGILDEMVGYLKAPELGPDEHEKMFAPLVSEKSESLREHCLLAIRHGSRLGVHGIPLIGNGDWNDGMNLVGPKEKGESVWLAWFLCTVLRRFASLLDQTGDAASRDLQTLSQTIAEATERHCWDGEWYLRAFFDTGEPLGASRNSEARIDSLAQSWSVISGVADPERAHVAMMSARDLLVDPVNKIVKLFTPPFDTSRPHPGYIMGYPPGLRENGGQYTHGSLWLAMGFARMGLGDEAERLLQMMNPVERTRTALELAHYRGEPYVVAADVSAARNRLGRSGWTWYTGSAAWMYRIWVEEVLGISVRHDRLLVNPVTPTSWKGFSFSYRFGSSTYEVDVVVLGKIRSGAVINLVDDGQVHAISLRVGQDDDIV